MEWTMKRFMKGAVLLTTAAIIVKLLSAVYRVPFQNIVGDQGFYIYQQVYPFIGIITVWTSYGFAVAISKLLAEAASQKQYEKRSIIIRVSLMYVSTVSILSFLFLYFGAPILARLMGDEQLAQLLRVGSFVFLCMPFIAIFKGLFQADGEMAPVAMAQMVEQAIRVAMILAGTFFIVRIGANLYDAGSAALVGTIIGEIAGIVWLYLAMKKQALWPQTTSLTYSKRDIVRDLTFTSLSASVSSLILLFFQLVDSFTVLNLLVKSGVSTAHAMNLKGIYDRGLPLVQLGILFASTLALSIVPAISYAAQKKSGRSEESYLRLAYKVSLLFGWAAAFGLMLLLPYLNEMLFETRAESIVLIVFSIQIVLLSILLTFTSVLQGVGVVVKPALMIAIGIVGKWLMNGWFIPQFGLMGAAISGNLAFLFITICLAWMIKSRWKTSLAPLRFYVHLTIASIFMAIVVLVWSLVMDQFIVDSLESRWQAVWISLTSVALGAIVFLYYVARSRLLDVREWYVLPLGRYFAGFQLWIHQKERNEGN